MSASNVQDAIIKQLRNDVDMFTDYGKALTGTTTFTNGSPVVTAIGAAFLTELRSRDPLGDSIVKGGAIRVQGSTSWYKVKSVDTDNQITLSTNFAEVTINGLAEHIHVRRGMPRNFNYTDDGRGLFLFLMEEVYSPTTLPNRKQDAIYPFIFTGLFYDDDDESAEGRKTQYAKRVRVAIERNLELSGSLSGESIIDMKIKDPAYYLHEQIIGGYYFQVPIQVKQRVPVGDN